MGIKAWLRGVRGYTASQTTPPSSLAQELYEDSIETFEQPAMSCGPVEAMLLQTLVAAVRAKRVLEIGMYTGFSALMMAEALPDDGELITCEINPDTIAFGKYYFERSPHGHKIDVREGPALQTLKTVHGPFDFVFLDADKQHYVEYYEMALPMLVQGGLLAADDVLLGTRLDPRNERELGMTAFNEHVRNDDRVSQVMITIRSGLTLIRKL
jgi:caffeoyl-CoA O-methyltransferase